jgi:hypothetical protein
MLKTTNDPLLSNKWWFYSPQEKESLTWIEYNLQEKSVWPGLDARLSSTFHIHSDVYNDDRIKFTRHENAEYWLISKTIEKRSRKLKKPLPPTNELPIIYDNGNVQIYDGGGWTI